MKLRNLNRHVTVNKTVNKGSRRYPQIEAVVEETDEVILQFSDDDGVTWHDVPSDYEYVEYDQD